MTDAHPPFHIEGATRPGRWLVTCDHARNTVPASVNGGDLGIAAADMARHIAWDVGAEGLARGLAEALDSPFIYTDFSRLVIDPNRGEDDPTLLMKLYDGTIIPANRHADTDELHRRLDLFHRPYHAAYAELAARRDDTVICAVHSFTPQLRGRPYRPWQVGILSAHDRRLADPLLDILRADPELCVGDNQPYTGHLDGDSVARHALEYGRPNALLELRNDLIETPDAQQNWATRLAPLLEQALARADL